MANTIRRLQKNIKQKDGSFITEHYETDATIVEYDSANSGLGCINAQEAIDKLADYQNNLTIGGRNLALGTSNEYKNVSYTANVLNNSTLLSKVLNDGFSVGDTMMIKAVIKYENIVSTDGQEAKIKLAGNGNVTAWGYGNISGSKKYAIKDSGEIEIIHSIKITSDHIKNQSWELRLVYDYIASGTLEAKNVKVENSTKPSSWTPAPEDITPSYIGAINVNKITDRLDVTEDGFVLGGKAGKSLQDQITDNKNNKLDKTGGTVTDRLYLQKGFNVATYIASAENGGGTRGYVNIAQLKILKNNCNSPIEFKISRRGCSEMTTINLLFQNASTVDPNLTSFIYSGNEIGAYLHKSNTSTWDLYVSKTEPYDSIAIVDVNTNMYYQGGRVNITYPGKFVEVLPSDTIKATFYNQASTSLVADKLSTARNITIDGHFSGQYSFDGSKDINLKLYNKYAMTHVGNRVNYPYHRIAKLEGTAMYSDHDMILTLHCPYKDKFGIIEVGCRRNGGTSEKSSITLKWIVRSNFNTNDVTVGYSNEYDNTYVDLFLKNNNTYDDCVISIVDSSHRNGIDSSWVLVNSIEVSNTTETSKLTSYECWKTIEEAGTELHGQAYTNIDTAVDSGIVNYANVSPLLTHNTQRPTDANIEIGKYKGISTMTASSNMTSNKPDNIGDKGTDGIILNLGWDTGLNWGSQLAVGANSNPHMAIRGCSNIVGWDKKWTHILDENNYASYVTPSAIGAVSKPTQKSLTIPNTGWVNEAHGSYLKKLVLSVAGITENMIVNLNIALESDEVAVDCGFASINESGNGTLTFYAESVPSASINATYYVLN